MCHLQCVRLRFCANLCEVLSSFLLRYTKLTVRLLTCVRKSVVGVTQTTAFLKFSLSELVLL